MNTQNQIKRTLSQTANTEYVSRLLGSKAFFSRNELADAVCEHFGFYDTRGLRQRSGCVKALRELEAAGQFVLPAMRSKNGGRHSPRRADEAIAAPRDVPAEAGDVRGLSLVLVNTTDEMRVWNELMIGEHPQGSCRLAGRQLRYLVGSKHGWLGGAGFGAAALQLSDRDRWIGWDAEQRRQHLHAVALAHRGLASRAQGRMPHREHRPRNRRAPATSHCHKPGDRVADTSDARATRLPAIN